MDGIWYIERCTLLHPGGKRLLCIMLVLCMLFGLVPVFETEASAGYEKVANTCMQCYSFSDGKMFP